MNDKFFRVVGIVVTCLGFGLLYFGAGIGTTEIASLSSKILGIVTSIGGVIISFLGGKKNGE